MPGKWGRGVGTLSVRAGASQGSRAFLKVAAHVLYVGSDVFELCGFLLQTRVVEARLLCLFLDQHLHFRLGTVAAAAGDRGQQQQQPPPRPWC